MPFARASQMLAPFVLAIATAALAQSPATLDIQLQKTLHPVSPTLYGLMTEEINYSYDGGLYAEMVSNRTFHGHGWDGVNHWFLVQKGDADVAMKVDETSGPSTALPESLELEVRKADAQNQAGVLNDGYWGMALKPNTTYHGSFYAKATADFSGPVTVSLVNNDSGQPVATATVASVGADWQKHEFTLETGAMEASAQNHLLITVAHPGTLWLDLVSVFPPTYDNTPNGNRSDLMKMLAAMHPAFLRLPGGNYLEGNNIAERFDWKTTIGPLVDRPTHMSPWGYRSSDGEGLLEFLEWCQDLHMQPLLAVYAGYSLNGEHVDAGPALEPYVQSALEEIEYVTGSTSTKWGAERAKDGHPKPFPLKYVEVGNEDQFDKSGSYDGRYAQFYKAIKQKYPQLQVIATTPVKSVRPDVIDDHFYRRATEFFADTTHYDKTDRNGPKIFVGEWATREGTPTPNFGAALGDAAWMTGMERNSDVVIMASYAPLFVNVNPGGMQWESDLIGYNAEKSYGSPSYYAQVMFSNHIGTEVVGSSLTGAHPRFFYSVTRNPEKGIVYLKLVNASSDAQAVNVKLDGAGNVDKTAAEISLSAKDTQETNSITDPTRIVPVDTKLSDAGANFRHTVPPYSIQVLELNAK